MANLTREQRAAKQASAPMHIPTFGDSVKPADQVPVNDQLAPTIERTRVDAREYAAKIRANRKDFSGLEQKMKHYGENPGWKRRYVNEDNVPARLEEGYRFVLRSEVSMSDSMRYGNTDMGDRVSVHAGVGTNGQPFSAYLMEIPLEIADELDSEKSHKKVKLSEASIRSGTVGNPAGNTRVGQAAGLPEIKLTS